MIYPEIKDIKIISFLKQLGYKAIREINETAWFLSPLRSEKTASFKVDLKRNTWYDFGTGEGGNFIELTKKYYQKEYPEVLDSIDIGTSISSIKNNSFLHSNKLNLQQKAESKIELDSISELVDKPLISYLNDRKISIKLGMLYLKEVKYHFQGKTYPIKALAFKNDAGGFELRNNLKFFNQFTYGTKTITTIKIPNSKAVNIFEGFMDFLSAMIYYGLDKPRHTTIVLNSCSMVNKVLGIVRSFKLVNLYLDTDHAGIECTNKIKGIHNNVTDFSEQIFPKSKYPDIKDFNEFLCKYYRETNQNI